MPTAMVSAGPIDRDEITCSICHESIPEGAPAIPYHDHDICLGCLTALVTRVIEDKDQYPINLGHRARTPFDYADHLHATLLEQYKLKEIEHSTFPAEHVFCACGKFVGRLIVHREGEEYIPVKFCLDTSCQRLSCLNCATKLEELGDIIDHGCKKKCEAKEEDKQKMRDSNERGKKFQLCPNCSRLIELTDACHHIKCPCKTEFCYLCGKPASENSNHWNRGYSCPRYPSQVPLPPARPLTDQDRRDLNATDPIIGGFLDRLDRIQEMRGQGPNDNEANELFDVLYDEMANHGIPLPPRRPEPRTPSPPPPPDIPRGVSPRPAGVRLPPPRGITQMFVPAGVRRLRDEDDLSDEDWGMPVLQANRAANHLMAEEDGIFEMFTQRQRDIATAMNRNTDATTAVATDRLPMFPPGRAPHLSHLPPFVQSAIFYPGPGARIPPNTGLGERIHLPPRMANSPSLSNSVPVEQPPPHFRPRPRSAVPMSRSQSAIEREAEEPFLERQNTPRHEWDDNDDLY